MTRETPGTAPSRAGGPTRPGVRSAWAEVEELAGPLRANRWMALVCLVAVLVHVSVLVDLYGPVDDAYISFRYLDNWLAGDGLVFNPGEAPVEGFTNLGWILALAPLRSAGLSSSVAALVLSLVALVAAAVAVLRAASHIVGTPLAGWTAVCLLLSSVPVARWTGAGLETVAFAALLTLAFQRLVLDQRHTPRSSLWFALAVIVRPTGALAAAVAFAVALLFVRRPGVRGWLQALALFVALPLAVTAFRLYYYGQPLPNTFYAKVSGVEGDWQFGLTYVWRFLLAGGIVPVLGAALLAFERRRWHWPLIGISTFILAHGLYVVAVGGDYFPYQRFLVPVVPLLCLLAAVGIFAAARVVSVPHGFGPPLLLVLVCVQTGLGVRSFERRAFLSNEQTRVERELVADWVQAQFPSDALLAINAAGVIPYRTGLPTVDMLGLSDAHIAHLEPTAAQVDGGSFVGHRKSDGDYVCARHPDLVLTSGAGLHRGRTPMEAQMQASLNTFVGDRAFLRSAGCADSYEARSEELAPGRYVVVFVPRTGEAKGMAAAPTDAAGWFRLGLQHMGAARLGDAVHAFERSLAIDGTNLAARVNLGYCFLDQRRYLDAAEHFEQVLALHPEAFDALYGLALARTRLGDSAEARLLWQRYLEQAPESSWKERARSQLELLQP